MGRLSKKEAAALKALQEKADAPDSPASNARLNVSVDLGDEAQIKRAQRLGLLDDDDDDDDNGDGDDDDDQGGEETPRRRGYFKGD